jgi:hypothetical protein
MEGSWAIKLDGKSHVVRASVPAISWSPRLTVHLDGSPIHTQAVFLVLGELCCLKVLGHDLSIRVRGFGLLGSFCLLIDGVEAAHSNDGLMEGRQPIQPFNRTLDASIVETQRVEELLGEEVREIDNSQSAVEIQRKIRVSREWSQLYSIERESTAKIGGELSVEGAWIVDFKATAEGAIRKRYELSTEDKKSYSEELTIEVPPRTKVQVVLKWKQIWQCGIVLVRNGSDGTESQIPFRVCLGPTFDQRQVDG